MPNRIMTMDELVRFCKQKNLTNFNAKDVGYNVVVQIPSVLRYESDTDSSREGMMKLAIRILHTGLNRNGSYVSKESADAAKASIANRPILAAIHQLSDGSYDFAGHEIKAVQDEEGNTEYEYVESQVGSFTHEAPFWETDTESGKEYLCAYAEIPTEYTKAAEIIKRKGGTKVSAELVIEQMSYDIKENYLRLDKWFVLGTTLLGVDMDTEDPIEEGMTGARADIADFRLTESVMRSFRAETVLIEAIERLNDTLSRFNIDQNSLRKGGMPMFEQLLAQYGKTAADITFDVTGMSDEELQAKFAEMFADGERGDVTGSESSSDDNNGDNLDQANDSSDIVGANFDTDQGAQEDTSVNNDSDAGNAVNEGAEGSTTDPDKSGEAGSDNTGANASGNTSGESDNPTGSQDDTEAKETKKVQYTITAPNSQVFEVSLNERISAIRDFVNATYAEVDEDYYSVTVYDTYVIMEGWCSGKNYRQSYTYESDVVALVGEREEVFVEYLTQSEKDTLNVIRSTYDELKEYKDTHESQALFSEKKAVIDQFAEALKDNASYQELIGDMDKYTAEELNLRCNALVGQQTMQTFAAVTGTKKTIAVDFLAVPPEKPYGGLFDE